MQFTAATLLVLVATVQVATSMPLNDSMVESSCPKQTFDPKGIICKVDKRTSPPVEQWLAYSPEQSARIRASPSASAPAGSPPRSSASRRPLSTTAPSPTMTTCARCGRELRAWLEFLMGTFSAELVWRQDDIKYVVDLLIESLSYRCHCLYY